jgi:N-acyl-L-homoserine lactone synthetase
MIHVISADNRHVYEDVLDQHFRLRHEIFVEERKWEVLRRPDGREIDAYDNEDAIYLLALDGRRVLGVLQVRIGVEGRDQFGIADDVGRAVEAGAADDHGRE